MVANTKAARAPPQSWHAVKVVGKGKACFAAEALCNKRFLSNEAPRLPLPGCSFPWRCDCIYLHYSDRRKDLRRETDRGNFPRPRFGTDRRESHGRRADDRNE